MYSVLGIMYYVSKHETLSIMFYIQCIQMKLMYILVCSDTPCDFDLYALPALVTVCKHVLRNIDALVSQSPFCQCHQQH